MAEPKEWTCTVCGRHTTIGDYDRYSGSIALATTTSKMKEQGYQVYASLTRCPNPSCSADHLSVAAHHGRIASKDTYPYSVLPDYARRAGVGYFQFLPATAQPLSKHCPSVIQEDYQEAYLIRTLSPKASATLARRALQGMVRDFWKIKEKTLHQELEAIKNRCDPDLYAAMMAIKSVGNIGAHPEQDISLIVEIEPGEPQQLLDVIHLLDQEWYVARADRNERLARMKELGAEKQAMRNPPLSLGDAVVGPSTAAGLGKKSDGSA